MVPSSKTAGHYRQSSPRNSIMTIILENTIRIYKKESKNNESDIIIKIGDVTAALNNKYSDLDPVKYIKTLANTNNKVWTIVFKDTFSTKKLIDRSNFSSIIINGIEHKVENASEKKSQYQQFVFRFINLPPNFDNKIIKDHMLREGFTNEEILDIYPEHHREEGHTQIENGVIRCKVKCIDDQQLMESRIAPMSKSTILGNWNVKINRVGEPRKCNHCGAIDHLRRNCPSGLESCTLCKSKYHTNSNCPKSYANQGKEEIHTQYENFEEPEVSKKLAVQTVLNIVMPPTHPHTAIFTSTPHRSDQRKRIVSNSFETDDHDAKKKPNEVVHDEKQFEKSLLDAFDSLANDENYLK